MLNRREQRLQVLFAGALELPAHERAAWLARECGDDARLIADVQSLLESDARLRDTTARPVLGSFAQLLEPRAALSGRRVGAWELREEIGRGGMGSVYRAERADGSVRQSAAIKFVHRELLDAATVRRFQLERQMMASLDHPYIARLFDAGQLDDGTPYCVMELVQGVPITHYCERERLDLRARVALMRKVCGAVSEAHRELIVHRDLKPGNILVDAAGNPKLLDFGIAKPINAAAGASGGEDTGTAQRYFSPQYAAPEQLSGSPVGVACDVYALGLLLYEVLSGVRPFDFSGLGAGQIERLVREVPPAAPSSALARQGGADIRVRQLRGDLDGIVMRCLRKLPAERYASVEQLEADLCNYLEGRPVQARGGHAWYRAQKFVWRNKLAVAAGALLAASLLGGAGAFAWQARIANRRAAELEEVAKFQADMLDQVDPTHAGRLLGDDLAAKVAESLTRAALPQAERDARGAAFKEAWQGINATDAARDLIDSAIVKPAVAAVDAKFADQPLVAARLKQTLADRYLDWGMLDAAQPLQQQALDIRRALLGEHYPDTLVSLRGMGLLLQARGDYPGSEALLRQVFEERRRQLGSTQRETLEAMNELADVLPSSGKEDEAARLLRDSLASLERAFGADDRDTLIAVNEMGMALRQQGKLAEAETYFRRALDGRRRVLGPDHPLTLVSLASVATVLLEQAKPAEADVYVCERLERQRRLSGETHPETLRAINMLANLYGDQGKSAQAEATYHDLLEKSRRTLGADHPDTVLYQDNLALFYMTAGRNAEADPLLTEVLEKRRKLYGPESQETLRTTIALAGLRTAQRRESDAVAMLAPVEAAARKVFTGDNIYQLSKLHLALGVARTRLDLLELARGDLENARTELAATRMSNNGDRADCAAAFAMLYTRLEKSQPGKGYAAKAAEEIRRAHELDPELPPLQGSEVPEKHAANSGIK